MVQLPYELFHRSRDLRQQLLLDVLSRLDTNVPNYLDHSLRTPRRSLIHHGLDVYFSKCDFIHVLGECINKKLFVLLETGDLRTMFGKR